MTDEEFSQILSSNQRKTYTVKGYIIYFIIYIVLEVLSPVMGWILGTISWFIIRCLIAFVVLNKNLGVMGKIVEFAKSNNEDLGRRNAELFKKF